MDAFAQRRRWLVRILAAALVIRLGAAAALNYWLEHQNPPRQFLIAGDAEGYWDLAGDFASGADYAVYQPPRRVLRMPGFPAILAVPRALFGDQAPLARFWLACVGTFACWCVWRLGADLAGEQVGLWGAAIAAASPVLVAFTPIILSETTFAAAMLVNLIAGGRLLRHHGALDIASAIQSSARITPPAKVRGSAVWALATGASAALACYVRPSWLLAAPLFCGALWLSSRNRRRALLDAVLVLAALVLVLLPWGLRNQRVTGGFVLTTLWMGPSLYDGLNPEATGDSNMAFFDRDNLMGRGWSETAVNQFYRDEALKFAVGHPRRALELAVVKLWRYWKPWPNAAQFRNVWLSALIAATFTPLLLLAAVGLVLLRRQYWIGVLLAGPILYFAAVHAVFVSSLRYRLPAEYPLAVLAAIAMTALHRRLTSDGAPHRATNPTGEA